MSTAFSRITGVTSISDNISSSSGTSSSTSYTVPSGKFAHVSVLLKGEPGDEVRIDGVVMRLNSPIPIDLNFYLTSGKAVEIIANASGDIRIAGAAIEMNNP